MTGVREIYDGEPPSSESNGLSVSFSHGRDTGADIIGTAMALASQRSFERRGATRLSANESGYSAHAERLGRAMWFIGGATDSQSLRQFRLLYHRPAIDATVAAP